MVDVRAQRTDAQWDPCNPDIAGQDAVMLPQVGGEFFDAFEVGAGALQWWSRSSDGNTHTGLNLVKWTWRHKLISSG